MNTLDIALLICAVSAIAFAWWIWANRTKGMGPALSFKTLADVAPAGIWRTSPDGQCIYVNKAWEEQTGLTDGAWLGHAWSNAIHPDDRERVFGNWAATVARREKFRDEWRWMRPDGSTMWVLTLGAPEFDAKGELVAYVGINMDIQRSKELESDLKRSRDSAEDTTAAKTNFLANMSHEIRTPMNGVIGFTDLLLQTKLDANQKRHVQLIADSGRAMMHLLNDILDLAKIESGKLELEKEPTDVRQKIRHCVRLLEPQAQEKGLVINQRVSETFPELIEADRLRLRQVLMNLIGNAVKFTEHGKIDVMAGVEQGSEGPCAKISVVDTGIGIAPEKLERIFHPFTQEDGSVTRRYGGTGLGLAITNQLVERMGGRIDVESEPGKGTSFVVRFPLKASRVEDIDEPVPVKSGAWDTLAGTRVLIAEDHQINQQLIMAMAETLDLNASLVEDGAEALTAVKLADREGKPYDIVLMDVQMPHMDGLEATRRIRASGFTDDKLPIIALTANCYDDDIAECRKAGMQSHIGKPVNCAALAREMVTLLQGAKAAEANDPTSMMRHASPALLEKYHKRKAELLDQVRRALEGTEAKVDWSALQTELHNLAGVAGNFGDEELGRLCSSLEKELRSAEDEERHLGALRDAWPRFEQAA